MHTDPLPSDTGPEQPAKPSLLEEMAALTGLFNPEVIWHEEEVLDKLPKKRQTLRLLRLRHLRPQNPVR
jgi:hypothetical protein